MTLTDVFGNRILRWALVSDRVTCKEDRDDAHDKGDQGPLEFGDRLARSQPEPMQYIGQIIHGQVDRFRGPAPELAVRPVVVAVHPGGVPTGRSAKGCIKGKEESGVVRVARVKVSVKRQEGGEF